MVQNKSKDVSDSHQTPTPRGEFFTLAGVAAAATGTIGVGEKIYKAVTSPDPFVLQVLCSTAISNFHWVEFQAFNQTIHGIYLESISLSQPQSKITRISVKERVTGSGLGMSSIEWVVKDPEVAFPKLIAPGASFDFAIEFPLINSANKPFGLISLRYSPLNEKAESERKDVFRIRWQ